MAAGDTAARVLGAMYVCDGTFQEAVVVVVGGDS